VVKGYCYYLISTFNHEFSNSFYSAIHSELVSDMTNFDNFDNNINALRNFFLLNEKEITDDYSIFEQIFKIPKYDLNLVINVFYFSNLCTNLIDVFDKLNFDDFRSHKEFLKRLFMELAKYIFTTKIDEGTFLNLIKIMNSIISKFVSFKNTSTKEKFVNSVIIFIANYLLTNIDEILDLLMSFDHKLLLEIIIFPINLYKIYNFFRDPNNPNKKFENSFHRYVSFLFDNIRNIIDPEVYSKFNLSIVEFKIIDNKYNPQTYSTEIVELVSKFFELCDIYEKSSEDWFDLNIKLLSKLVDNIDYTELVDLTLNLLSESRSITNLSDRIITLFNLFYRLIIVNIDYSNFFEKESLILCLFKQDWFVLLIKGVSLEDKESRFRHDFFISLIEALFQAKIYLLKSGNFKKLINWIKICLDIIDVCFKIIEWEDEGESYKMYFLVLEETCLFFDDSFYGFLFGQENEFISMKTRLDQVLLEISKRFTNKVWSLLSFANENSKYRSLLLLSQFLTIDNVNAINIVLEVIFLRMNEIPTDKKNEKFVEQILRSCLFLGIRVNLSTREKIIQNLAEFVEKIKQKFDSEISIINNIRSFAENILNYLLDHKSDPQIILDSKIVDKLNNEFYLIIPKDVEMNLIQKKIVYNNLYLMNICCNSNFIINSINENSSLCGDYFRKMYLFPIFEFNNDYSNVLIDNQLNYKFSDWILVSGISDPVHIYYMYKLNLEKREIELFVRCFNSTSCVLNNVSIHIYLSKNLTIYCKKSGLNNQMMKEFHIELISPFSLIEYSAIFHSKIFERNNINIDCTFDMMTDYNTYLTMNSESFHIPLIDFFVKDSFCLYETKKFDLFYQTLEYAFTFKCFASITPDELLKSVSANFVMVEYKSKNKSIDHTKTMIDRLKQMHFKDFFQRNSISKGEENFMNSQNVFEESQRYNFKVKLSSYCVYNFWVYIIILGDYNFQNNKSILNIEVKSNDLGALNIISREKYIFFNEVFNKQIKFY
jgi:hypothetical protein